MPGRELHRNKLCAGLIAFLLLLQLQISAQCTGLAVFATNSMLNCLTSTTTGTVQVWSGTPPYTYTWLPTGGNGSVAVNLSPNSYTIYVQDANGCTGYTQLLIYNSTGVTVIANTTDPTCFGGNNGQIVVTTAGPAAPPYSYSWTPAAPNSATNTNLSAGTYTMVMTDANSCKYTKTVTLNQPPAMIANVATQSITCPGGISGATVTAGGGVGPYSYSWSPGPGSSAVLNNIPAGSYSVTVTDAKNCQLTKSVTITQPPVIISNLTTTNVACNGFTTGAAAANASGGTGPYTYSWTPIGGTTTALSNLTAGNYTLLVKDSRNCPLTHSFSITQPAPFTYTVARKDEFCVNADGSATLTLNGGTAPYTYTWTTTPVQNGFIALNMPAGNYTAFVTDAANCQLQVPVTIGNISNLSPHITSKADVNCHAACNGSVTAGITGGSPPFLFSWIGVPSGSTAGVSNLCAGQYTVKITDNLGCYTYTTVNITEPAALSSTVTGASLICSGQTTSLSAVTDGGAPGYTYNWLPGNISGASVSVTPTLTTNYTVVATDSKGCTGTKQFLVTVNPPLLINSGANSLTVCPNVNASITISPSGGDGNYSYLWQPGNITTQNLAVNLQSSVVYTVTIKDGCGTTPVTTTVNITIHQTQQPTFTADQTRGCEPLCIQFNNTTAGSLYAQWQFGDFSPAVVSSAATHCYMKPGKYKLSLMTTDIHGCKSELDLNDYIVVYGKPKADFIHEPAIIDLNTPDATFESSSINASSFTWIMDGLYMTSKQNFEHTFFNEGCYNIRLIAANENFCSDTTDQQICITQGYNFWIPNAFTPDGDGKNEIFIPKGTGWKADNYSFEILDRWGNMIFKTSDLSEGWNGKMGGTKASDDVYVWRIKVTDLYDNDHEYNGKVMLMR